MKELEVESPKYGKKVILFDDEDYDKIKEYGWSISPTDKYAQRFYATGCKKLGYKRWQSDRMHRVVMCFPKGKEVDHVDGNGLNNQKSNLRICTRQENSRNRDKKRKRVALKAGNKVSIYKGVQWFDNGKNQYWQARIVHNYENIIIGYFKDEVEAAQAYDARARELHGEFARLNFP